MGTTLEDILRLSQQLTTPDQTPPQQMQVARPSTVVGLLGNALGGGSTGNVPLTQEQADAEGRGALLNFGLSLLENSGYSTRRRSLGQLIAGGIRGAQGSIGDYESQLAARQAALQAQQQQSLENRFRGIDAATKVAELQQKLRQLQGIGAMTLNGTGTGGGGGGGDTADIYSLPKEQFLAAVAKRESGGDPTALNYVAKADPSAIARGATASGKYQMVDSTWLTAAKAAGIDTSKYPTARDAPEAVQDQVASKLYDLEGTNPWNPAKFGQRWVKGEGGKYTLEKGSGEGGGGATTPATKTPTGVQMGGEPPPPPGGSGKGATRGVGAALNEPVIKATPIPVGKLQSTGKPPGQAAVDQPSQTVAAIEEGRQRAEAMPTVPGTVLTAGPGAGTPPGVVAPAVEAKAEPGWGSQVGTYGAGPVPPTPAPTTPAPATPSATPAVIPQGDTQQQPARESFKYVPSPLPDALKQYTTKELQPQQLKDIQARRAQAQTAFDQAKSIGNIDGMQKARDQLDAANKDEAQLLQTQSGDVQKMVQEFYGKDFDQQRKDYDDRQAHARALEIQQAKLKADTELEQTKTGLATGSKIMDGLNTQAVGARQKIDNLDLLSVVSAGVDDDGFARKLSTMRWGDTTAANKIATWGLTSDDFKDKVGKINQLQAMINNTVTSMRQGMSMGPLSDRDLSFIQAMTPDMYQNKATREGVIKLLREMAIRQSRFANEVGRLWDDGKGIKIHDAINQAGAKLEKDNPIIPAFTADEEADPAKFAAFAKKHRLQRGAIIRNPNGDLGTLD